MTINLIFGLTGGLGLFIYGMQLMGDGLQKAAGDRLRKILEILTTKPWRGVIVGSGVTALIQSSSATTVMLVGFVNAGLMTLSQAIGVIFGANIGTTITAQIIAFKISDLALPAIGLGFALTFFSKKKVLKYLGQFILGFGLLFLGLNTMKTAMSPLKDNESFIRAMIELGKTPLLGVFVGILMTALIQSSSATIGILIALASQNIISINTALPILIGDNIGTCVTALLSSIGTSITAKRTAVAHVSFNTLGAILFLAILPFYDRIVILTSNDISRQIANAHTIFNFFNTIIWLPMVGLMVKIVQLIVPGEEIIIDSRPIFIEKHLLYTPSIALGQATKETVRMAIFSHEMLKHSLDYSVAPSKKLLRLTERKENVVDKLAHEITRFLSILSQESLSLEQSERITALMHAINDIERSGDHAESLINLFQLKNDDKLVFSEKAQNELDDISNDVSKMYDHIIVALDTNDFDLVREVQLIEEGVDKKVKKARNEHIKRLNQGLYQPVAGVVFLDIVNHLERIGDLANNVGFAILGEMTKY